MSWRPLQGCILPSPVRSWDRLLTGVYQMAAISPLVASVSQLNKGNSMETARHCLNLQAIYK